MSYDLMAFEISKAPKDREEFLKWYDKQTEWKEEHDYDNINVSSEKLQNFYLFINIVIFFRRNFF